ncbi:YitT family protein [Pontibacillus salipaludis]|uniref:Membrane protein n=1 Tax=Pontibacillus salipaludis TaxID=1697394 RepID=A0ABQ1PT01_9BACI|nr:YitT family protein [Pontibacillus salipaludis]GGD03006.1 membrane protein [Pontibacillus salipaludis]
MQHVKNVALIIIGSFIFSLGINYFAIPNGLSEGGIIGISIVLYYVFDLSTGLSTFILNTILILVGFKYLDKQMMIYTFIGIFTTSFFLWLTEHVGTPIESDSLLAPIYAGLFAGGGIGVIFRAGGTSGGTQIISQMMKKNWGWSMANATLFIDMIVIGGSVFVIGQKKALLTVIAVYVGARAIEFIVDGLNMRKAVTIISETPDEVLEAVNSNVPRGVTVLEGYGGYSKKDKKVLYVVVHKQETFKLQRIINEVDEQAFVVIHDVRNAFGGGFK